MRRTFVTMAALVALVAGSGRAAPLCDDPGAAWGTAAPGDVGLDAGTLQEAMDFATPRATASLRVYREGCLVGQSRIDPLVEDQTFESMSMAKSVTSMIVGRAVTLGLLDLDDTIGDWFPEADAAHAPIPLRELLTMSSGLHWNFFRDYNLAMPDRVQDTLDLQVDRNPGTWFEYAQSPVALVAEMVTRAAGEDVQEFAQRELFTPIGIQPGTWTWERDQAGNTVGFYGLRMRPADWGRLGHLMLRHGQWGSTQLIAGSYVDATKTPSPANAGYGFFFWLNGEAPWIAPTIYSRDVRHRRGIESAPEDLYMMAGFQNQRVYVIPDLDMVVTRLGVRGSIEGDTRVSVFTSASGEFEHELFRLLMRAVEDRTIQDPGPYPRTSPVPDVDPYYGILRSAQQPDDILAGMGL